jgi:hypothetical protein
MFRVTFFDFGKEETHKFDSLSRCLAAVIGNPGASYEIWQTLPSKESIRIA